MTKRRSGDMDWNADLSDEEKAKLVKDYFDEVRALKERMRLQRIRAIPWPGPSKAEGKPN